MKKRPADGAHARARALRQDMTEKSTVANTIARRAAKPSEPSSSKNEGYRVLRFWNNEILENLDGVHRTIADVLATSPPPKPSPIKGIKGEGFSSSC